MSDTFTQSTTFTFRMTLPKNWVRIEHALLDDPAAVEAQLQKHVAADRITGGQADAMADVFAGLAPQLRGLRLPLVAAYAEPTGDGRFALAAMHAGPHAGGFPVGSSPEAITVNDAPGKLIRGTVDQPFGREAEITVFSAQYVLASPVPQALLVVTATTPVTDDFDPAAAEARFNEAVREIIFHPVA